MNELYEALKGFTDVPLAILSFIFALLCRKNHTSKDWTTLFFVVAAAALLGAFVHGVALPPLVGALIWVVLYPLLFEAVRRFGVVFGAFADGQNKPSPRPIWIAEILLYIGAVAMMFAIYKNASLNFDILVFIAFAVIVFVYTLARMVKSPKLPKLAIAFVVLLAVPVLLQAFEAFIPYAVVIEHTFLAIALFIAYRIALTTKTKE